MSAWTYKAGSGFARQNRSRSVRQNLYTMFYVYTLKSNIDNRIYIGYTTDLKTRFKRHNTGKVKSTKANKPWVLIYYEAYRAKPDATKREKQLKLHAAKNELKSRLTNSLK